ncbi:unnamed protein product, partial [Tetraodon nigroviridis]
QQDFASWMRKNIHKKECCFFERDKSSEDVCVCGYLKSEHTDEAIKTDEFRGQSWKKHRHVRQGPTDAFGDISFSDLGHKTGKVNFWSPVHTVCVCVCVCSGHHCQPVCPQYARVSTDTSPETLYQLLTGWWQLSPPNLLISVTGGAKNFCLKAGLKKMFHRGLIKVAQTTGAWVITGGTHTGVMKHVGEAVKDYALSSSTHSQIVAIGVATWGIIHNRGSLVEPKYGNHGYPWAVTGLLTPVYLQGCFPARYQIDEEGQGRFSCLDNNHTHFLLVDDGTQGHYGLEIELRTGLEKFISGKNLGHKGSNVTIPVVCVVLDGGPGTLNTIYNAMINGTPCVVFEGSGRIADVIAHVAGLPVGRITIQDIKKLMRKFFGQDCDEFSDTSIVEWTKKIQDIVRMTHLLSVFRASEDNHGDVDTAILQALLKASKTRESFGIENLKRQLELAIAWNRVDLAETEIFTEERSWKSSDLHKALFLALVGNKPEFVRLLLENGASLSDFLHRDETLCELYSQMPACWFRRKLPKSNDGVSLAHVSAELKKLLGRFTQHLYPNTAHNEACSMSLEEPSSPSVRARGAEAQREASRDLLLWAVVQKNKELAEIAWAQVCLVSATGMMKSVPRCCWSVCRRTGGGPRALQLALEANDQDFVAQSGVQALLTKIWCGELSVDNPVWRVLLCMVVFPLIYTGFLIFRSGLTSGREFRKAMWLRCLYSCPQVKFYWNIVSYFAFLFLFAVVLMVDFQLVPSKWELLLYVWLLTLVFEEVRQLFDYRPDLEIWKKARLYISDVWNILDSLSIVLFITGLSLRCHAVLPRVRLLTSILCFRLTTWLFYPGKVILCITFVVFCLRLMAIFTISRTLGPKIIIVRRMMTDMFFFMFLLSIWVVAYGVAKQGILIDNDDRPAWILRGVLYEPYRIIFGDFPTNIDYAAFDIDACSVNGTNRLKPKCPVLNEHQMPAFPEWLTIIMLCIYLLFANILLLNLLIAIFNFTFQEVQDNTDKIWKFQRYQLIKEYHSRPPAPPPLIVLNHLHLFFKCLMFWKPSTTGKEFQIELLKSQEEELLSWEALMKDRYLVSLQQEQSGNTERRVQETVQRLADISDQLEKDEKRSEAVMRRLARLEEQAVQSARALQWIVDTLKSQDIPAKDAPRLSERLLCAGLCIYTITVSDKRSDWVLPAAFPTDEASGQTAATAGTEEQHHVKARRLHYPGSTVTRFPVPEEKVPWEV